MNKLGITTQDSIRTTAATLDQIIDHHIDAIQQGLSIVRGLHAALALHGATLARTFGTHSYRDELTLVWNAEPVRFHILELRHDAVSFDICMRDPGEGFWHYVPAHMDTTGAISAAYGL